MHHAVMAGIPHTTEFTLLVGYICWQLEGVGGIVLNPT